MTWVYKVGVPGGYEETHTVEADTQEDADDRITHLVAEDFPGATVERA